MASKWPGELNPVLQSVLGCILRGCAGEHGQVHTEPVGIAARDPGCLTFLFRVMPAILLVGDALGCVVIDGQLRYTVLRRVSLTSRTSSNRTSDTSRWSGLSRWWGPAVRLAPRSASGRRFPPPGFNGDLHAPLGLGNHHPAARPPPPPCPGRWRPPCTPPRWGRITRPLRSPLPVQGCALQLLTRMGGASRSRLVGHGAIRMPVVTVGRVLSSAHTVLASSMLLDFAFASPTCAEKVLKVERKAFVKREK